MGRYAMVDDANGIVVNVVVWDGDLATWQPPDGYTMVEEDTAGSGWSYDGFVFRPPPSGLPGAAREG